MHCLICCCYLRWLETLWQTNFGKWRLIVMEMLYKYHFSWKSEEITITCRTWLPEKSVKSCLPRPLPTCTHPARLQTRDISKPSYGKQVGLLFPTGLHASRAAPSSSNLPVQHPVLLAVVAAEMDGACICCVPGKPYQTEVIHVSVGPSSLFYGIPQWWWHRCRMFHQICGFDVGSICVGVWWLRRWETDSPLDSLCWS